MDSDTYDFSNGKESSGLSNSTIPLNEYDRGFALKGSIEFSVPLDATSSRLSMVTGLSSLLYSNIYLPFDDTSDEIQTASSLQERKDSNLPNNDPVHISSTYAQTFGVSLQSYTMFTAIIIVPSSAHEYNELCDRIMLSLSHYSVFCRLSAHNRDDLSCIIDNIHCDICIVYKELLGIVSQTYPDLCCSVFDYQYIKVMTVHLLNCRMIQILKTYSFVCLVFSTRSPNG